MKKHDTPTDTLTPQRKHRKLLKDGSGVEVWPESIEKTFVQGLKEYWQSPYATYSQSRGRSRWRNQFLVDYLQRHGIQRTKKQVASHIQVLRNMWKGQPEFHLVAGGDEIVDPVTHIPIKEEADSNHLVSLDWEESSSHSASPDFSPPDSHSDFPLTPEQRPNLYPSDSPSGLAAIKQESSPGGLYFLSSPSTSPYNDYTHALPTEYSPTNPATYKQLPPQFTGYPYTAPAASPAATSFSQIVQNRITTFFLCAEGMTPFSVNVDALAQTAPSTRQAFTLRIKLSVPLLNDVRSPSTLHGFNASVSVANVWSNSAKCTTKVYAANNLVSEEHDNLQVSHINANGTVHALFPDSSLTRCRWLDHNLPTTVTQELAVDDQVLLFLIYELDRKNGPMPCSEFLGFQHYRMAEKPANPQSTSLYTSSTSRRMSQQLSPVANPYSIPPR
ncbi:hypothetical protein CC1G_04277 [Coprinopsis cinerea okayama7|uniref:TEA domain-containing protein n=1 Tax=Coprinopsis cinerea (strain Okayama-7 / 130 / ATCC MYA-4618 / FGSC 9003) TaxID=240176 RepID=A8NFJ2_COPC7|nr:hypothetical protein CC1G_04277 [Coprinopsis cinerea okayama7\|eukprot:XP_001833298.1 hypothetical protein CC1G_04277 [Coprinopsis cinerea okayama7\